MLSELWTKCTPAQKALQHTLNLANMYHPAECNALAEDKCVLKDSPDCPKDTKKLLLKDSNNQWRGRRGRDSAHWFSNLNLLDAAVIKQKCNKSWQANPSLLCWLEIHFHPEKKYSECIKAFVYHPACVMWNGEHAQRQGWKQVAWF